MLSVGFDSGPLAWLASSPPSLCLRPQSVCVWLPLVCCCLQHAVRCHGKRAEPRSSAPRPLAVWALCLAVTRHVCWPVAVSSRPTESESEGARLQTQLGRPGSGRVALGEGSDISRHRNPHWLADPARSSEYGLFRLCALASDAERGEEKVLDVWVDEYVMWMMGMRG